MAVMAWARASAWALFLALGAGCGGAGGSGEGAAPLVAGDGAVIEERALLSRARFTVLVFYSPDCHCLTAHEARLRDLEAIYRSRDVQFFWIHSEVGASPARDAAEGRARGYTFPILEDPGAREARRFGARYATYSVLVDAAGAVHYRGGVDSDRIHLTADAEPYLRNALDDVLAGRAVRVSEGRVLGCSLRTW
jgi:hypothetical protein